MKCPSVSTSWGAVLLLLHEELGRQCCIWHPLSHIMGSESLYRGGADVKKELCPAWLGQLGWSPGAATVPISASAAVAWEETLR